MFRAAPLLLVLLAGCATPPPDDDADVREAARRLTQSGRGEEPIAILTKVLERSPGHVEARLMRAALILRAGRRREALADYDAAIAANPKHADARMARALAQDLDDCEAPALADACSFIDLRPEEESGFLLRGWIHRKAGRKTEAFNDFEKARALGRARWSQWYNAGVSSLTLRRLDEAERLFAWAAELDGARPEIHMALGRVHLELGRPEPALADFTRAADLSNDADAWFHRANTLIALRRHAEAKEDYDRSIARRPGEAAAYYGRAIAKIGLGDPVGAERDLTACLERAPGHQEALQQRASLRISQNNLDGAEEDLIRALTISATAEWVGRLAGIYASKRDWTKAVATYESAVRLCQDDALRLTLEAELARARREKDGR